MSDTVLVWVEGTMIAGIVLAVIASCLVARGNKRIDERIKRRRERRRQEREAATANIDALAGRPGPPSIATPSQDTDSNR